MARIARVPWSTATHTRTDEVEAADKCGGEGVDREAGLGREAGVSRLRRWSAHATAVGPAVEGELKASCYCFIIESTQRNLSAKTSTTKGSARGEQRHDLSESCLRLERR